GPITSLEQAMLPHAADRNPTRLFGTYNTVATLAGALGALAAGGPTLLHTGSSRWLLAYPAAAVLCVPVRNSVAGGRARRRARRRAGAAPFARDRLPA